MSGNGVSAEVGRYLAQVREHLADLPAEDRDDLLSEVEASLVESASESSVPIDVRLGPPEKFANELRTAAGLGTATPRPGATQQLRRTVGEWAARAGADPRVMRLRAAARPLLPAWWVARGYLAVAAFALLIDSNWSIRHPEVPTFGSGKVGLLVIGAAIAGSCWLGMRGVPARASHVVAALNLALVAAIAPVIQHLQKPSVEETRFQAMMYDLAASTTVEPVTGLVYDGRPLTNVYAYSRNGRMLHDILLYDENGRPLDMKTGPDRSRRVLVTTSGARLFNSFPIRYFEPGTRRVARPNAGPHVRRVHVLTPPLRAR